MVKATKAKISDKSGVRPGKGKSSSSYDVHPGVAIMQKWMAELKANTGRTLDEWIQLTQKDGPADGHKARVEWLRQKHNLSNNVAWAIAERAGGKGFEGSDPQAYLEAAEKYVDEQYSAKKQSLRPIYDELLELGRSLAQDVKACPCQTMVPFYRNHVFAQIKPTTNSRIDLGFALAEV